MGKVSAMARDLSPIQVGAQGVYEGEGFEVIGGVRRAHETARWCEWLIRFDKGSLGWLGEGNGLWRMFRASRSVHTVKISRLKAGDELELCGKTWRVTESAWARATAAEGAVIQRVAMGVARQFADLTAPDGISVASLEEGDDDAPSTLWMGQWVDLQALRMKGLRAFTGWSSPAELSCVGPELRGSRALSCPRCAGRLELRSPADTQRLSCPYCGSVLGVEELEDSSVVKVLQAYERRAWAPTLPLGLRGSLFGVEWQIIGAQRRFVEVEGERYYWTEYAAFNPYVGHRWLVEDGRGHWSFVERITASPGPARRPSAKGHAVTRGPFRFGAHVFRHFQSGVAECSAVLGEFGWRIAVGDKVDTHDYVAPPEMLSLEIEGEERTWARGRYLPLAELQAGFPCAETRGLAPPMGVGPHQPNPLEGPEIARRVTMMTVSLYVAAVAAVVLTLFAADNEELLGQDIVNHGALSEVVLTKPFEVPHGWRRDLTVEVDTMLSRELGQVTLAVMNQMTGEVYYPIDTRTSNRASGRIRAAAPGPTVLRVEVARPAPIQTVDTVRLRVVRDKPMYGFLVLPFFVPLLLPLSFFGRRGAFETARWAESDHG